MRFKPLRFSLIMLLTAIVWPILVISLGGTALYHWIVLAYQEFE